MNTSHRIPDEPSEPVALPIDLARDAIAHTLRAICESPAKYWLMGAGTETYARLTAAYAALRGIPVEDARTYWQPDRAAYDAWKAQHQADRERLDLVEQLQALGGTTDHEALQDLMRLGRDTCSSRRLNMIDGGAR